MAKLMVYPDTVLSTLFTCFFLKQIQQFFASSAVLAQELCDVDENQNKGREKNTKQHNFMSTSM